MVSWGSLGSFILFGKVNGWHCRQRHLHSSRSQIRQLQSCGKEIHFKVPVASVRRIPCPISSRMSCRSLFSIALICLKCAFSSWNEMRCFGDGIVGFGWDATGDSLMVLVRRLLYQW